MAFTGVLHSRQVEDLSGASVSGAKIYFYLTGTSTLVTVYSDAALTTPTTNPVIADAAGYFTAYTSRLSAIDMVIKSADDAITYSTYSVGGTGADTDPENAEVQDLDVAGTMTVGNPTTGDYSATDGEVNVEKLFDDGRRAAVNITADTIVTVAPSGADYTTAQAALNEIAGWHCVGDATITLSVLEDLTVTDAPILKGRAPHGGVIIQGPEWAEETTLSAVTVTGSAGAWSVTATLADAGEIAINDYVRVTNVRAGWHVSAGALTDRPNIGELHNLFFKLGELSLSSTTATLSGSGAASYLANGDLIVAGAEVRALSSLATSGFSVSSAFTQDITGRSDWFATRPATGTIAISGSTVTGTGTAFLTEVNVGDLLLVDGYSGYRITAVASDTSMTISSSITVSAGAAFGICSFGTRHEGAFKVTNVSGNDVTWLNTDRRTNLPANNIISGNVKKFAAVITGNQECLIPLGGHFILDRIALVTTSSSHTAIDGRQDNINGATATIECTDSVAILGGNYWGQFEEGVQFVAVGSSLGGGSTGGARFQGNRHNLSSSNIHGSVGNGIVIDGANVRLSDSRVCGHSVDNVRVEVGGSMWGDYLISVGCGSRALHPVGGVDVHCVGSVLGDALQGYNGENGGMTRGSGTLAICTTSYGIASFNGSIEFTRAQVMGCDVAPWFISGGKADLENSAVGGKSDQPGLTITDSADVFGRNFSATDVNYVALISVGGRANLPAYDSARIGTADFNITANQIQGDGSVVWDGASDVVGVESLSIAGGKAIEIDDIISFTHNFGTVGAGTKSTHNVAVTGALALRSFGELTCNGSALPSGVFFGIERESTTTNQFTIFCDNTTGGGVAIGNRSWRLRHQRRAS